MACLSFKSDNINGEINEIKKNLGKYELIKRSNESDLLMCDIGFIKIKADRVSKNSQKGRISIEW